ncbi:MAG: WhiB family transcriptional regulator [Egibacteraceae bacterium]
MSHTHLVCMDGSSRAARHARQAEPHGWRARAACPGEDTTSSFPLGATGRALDQMERATRGCAGGHVVVECLQWALTTGQGCGIRGGFTEAERADLRRGTDRSPRQPAMTGLTDRGCPPACWPCTRVAVRRGGRR